MGMIETTEQRSFFEMLYSEFRDMMYAKAKSILHDSHLAEDAVHTAFIRVANNFELTSAKLRNNKSVKEILKTKNLQKECPKIGAYLIIIVKNVSLNMIKDRNKFQYTEDENVLDLISEEYVLNADDEIIIKEQIDRILEALNAINETSRDALYLNVVLDMNAKMISEQLDCNYDAVRKRIQRGKAELRKKLNNESKQ